MSSSEFQFNLLHVSAFDLWRIHKTLVEMLTENGYIVPEPLRTAVAMATNAADFDRLYVKTLKKPTTSKVTVNKNNNTSSSTTQKKKKNRKAPTETDSALQPKSKKKKPPSEDKKRN